MKTRSFVHLGALFLSNTVFGLPGGLDKRIGAEVIYKDPQPHTISAADLALLNKTEGTTGFYVPTGGFTPLEFSFDNSTLEKRAGNRQFVSFGGYSCATGTEIVGFQNFGCGQCVTWTGCGCSGALSALLSQQSSGNPKPTASLFTARDPTNPLVFSVANYSLAQTASTMTSSPLYCTMTARSARGSMFSTPYRDEILPTMLTLSIKWDATCEEEFLETHILLDNRIRKGADSDAYSHIL